jgi:tetratricopeptide (TPR) repeat protein
MVRQCSIQYAKLGAEALMKPELLIGPPDSHHLAAAEGWLGLGDDNEAERELKQISKDLASHPEVLRVRYHLYEARGDWERAAEQARALCELMPGTAFGWVHLAYALHELKRTGEAYRVLHPIVGKFPKEFVIPYNLACYACRLGELNEARGWLKKAIALTSAEEIKHMALADPDLRELQAEIRKF